MPTPHVPSLLSSPGPHYTVQQLSWTVLHAAAHISPFSSASYFYLIFVDSMELEPTFLPVLMDFTLKSTENCLSIIATNLVPNLHYARQEVSLALLL